MKFWVKLHPVGRDIILAVCDEEFIGRKFSEGKLQITVYESFYRGVLVDEKGLEEHMKSATILNLVGRKCIEKAIEMGWVDPENILSIGEVQHAQAAILFDEE
jgi:hypothetical protein